MSDPAAGTPQIELLLRGFKLQSYEELMDRIHWSRSINRTIWIKIKIC